MSHVCLVVVGDAVRGHKLYGPVPQATAQMLERCGTLPKNAIVVAMEEHSKDYEDYSVSGGWCFTTGDVWNGLDFHGPFRTSNAAHNAVEQDFSGDWYVAMIRPISEMKMEAV